MKIRVAIDSGPLTSGHAVRGIGVMVREQIDAIHEFGNKDVVLDAFNFDSAEGLEKLENGNYDIVHYPVFFPYALTLPPKKYGKKTIVAIIDLIHLIYPEKYPPGLRGRLNLFKQKMRLRNIDHVITISETSKKDIVRLLGISSEDVTTVYLAPKDVFRFIKDKKRLEAVRKKYKLPEKFVFNLGDINYNKNIPTLIDACEIADIPLVLGGKHAKDIEDIGLIKLMDMKGPMDYLRFLFNKPHPEHAHYLGMLDKFNNSKKIMRLGFIPDEDVAEVMNLATVYCQPSFYEGFGFSVLHAYVCGVPTVISKTNCLVEVFGDTSLIADPNSATDMAEKIRQALDDTATREKLIKRGFERARDFSYKKMGKELVDVYLKVASRK